MTEEKDVMPWVRVVALTPREAGPSGTKAFVDVVIGNHFKVMGIRVVQGKNGLFVSMPFRRAADGSCVDTFHPVSREARELLHAAVMAAYRISKGGFRIGTKEEAGAPQEAAGLRPLDTPIGSAAPQEATA